MKSKAPSLAAALSVRSKTKMAKGGDVPAGAEIKSSEMDVVRNKKKLDRLSNKAPVQGVHRPTASPGSSAAGVLNTAGPTGKIFSKDAHETVLKEMKSMPKPKLQGLAEGGIVKHPSTPFTTKSSKMIRDEEEQRARMPIKTEEMGKSEENDDQVEPQGLMQDDDQQRPEESVIDEGNIPELAEGGEVDAQHEDEIEHHASIAAAIMAKSREAKMMAEGGMVDIESHDTELPSKFHEDDEAALKENFSADMDHMSDPEESNEHGDSIESDKHDLVARIRAKMRKSPMVK